MRAPKHRPMTCDEFIDAVIQRMVSECGLSQDHAKRIADTHRETVVDAHERREGTQLTACKIAFRSAVQDCRHKNILTQGDSA